MDLQGCKNCRGSGLFKNPRGEEQACYQCFGTGHRPVTLESLLYVQNLAWLELENELEDDAKRARLAKQLQAIKAAIRYLDAVVRA